MSKDNWYLYRHLKPCGEVFYIGIGKTENYKRANCIYSRNRFWKNIVAKYGYEIQILKSNMTKEEACELEIILISWYGRADLGEGKLCNMTDGGDGATGSIRSEEAKRKTSEAQLGEKNHMFGKKGELSPSYGIKKHTPEQKEIWSKNRKGTQTGKDNPFYGRKHTPEQIEKWKNDPNKSLKGELNPMYGRKGELAPCYGRTGELHPMFGKEGYWKGKKLPQSAIENMKNKGGKIILDMEVGVFYLSIREAAEYCGLSVDYLGKVFRGEYKNRTNLRVV